MGIREETEKRVFAYIEEQGMIAPGDHIIAGVSGGADSVCLLLLLQAYGRKVPLSLAVAHVEHGIREDAMEDARYVEELCGQMGIPFFLTRRDVRSLALEERCSEEDAGRRVRYQAFRQAAERLGGGKVAVAHNSNDNAETMLFHLFRGSGIKGISGIPPVREEGGTSIIRPILCLEREEVEAYLRERQVPWRTDSTNSGDEYRRNRIRHHILPYVQQEIAGGAVRHMAQTARQLRETESYLAEQTESALRTCLLQGKDARGDNCIWNPADRVIDSIWEAAETRDDGSLPNPTAAPEIGHMPESPESGAARYVLDVAAFGRFHEVLQKRMLFALIKRLSPTGKDISAVHVHDALTLFTREGNRTITLPFGINACRQYGQVVLERKAEPGQNEIPPSGEAPRWREQPVTVPLGEEIFQAPFLCPLGGEEKLEFTAFFIKKDRELPKNQCTKWFDYDKMEECVVVRSREEGDFFTISDGAGNVVRKSLKKYMIAEKIPKQLRDEMPLVAMGSHVLWLVGRRISEHFKIDGNTRRVLQVRWCCGDSKTEEEDVRAR